MDATNLKESYGTLSETINALIKLGYNYRLGVLFWESIISLFNVFPIFYLIFFTLYLINYFIFGLGSGKIILPQTKPKRKKRKK